MLRVLPVLFGAICSLLLSACSLFPHNLSVDIAGKDLKTLESLYVIVGPADKLKAKTQEEYSDLVGSAHHDDYRTFAQFEPSADGQTKWNLQKSERTDALITVEAEEHEPTLHMKLKKGELLKLDPSTTILLLASYDNRHWEWKSIPPADVANMGDIEIRVGPKGFEIQLAK